MDKKEISIKHSSVEIHSVEELKNLAETLQGEFILRIDMETREEKSDGKG